MVLTDASNEIMEEAAASDDWITASLCPGRVSNPEPVPCNTLALLPIDNVRFMWAGDSTRQGRNSVL